MSTQFMDSYQAIYYILHQFSRVQIVKALCTVIGKDKVLEIISEEVS